MVKSNSSPIRTILFNIVTNPKRVAQIGGLVMLWQRTYFDAQKKVTRLEDATLIETPLDDLIPPEEHAIYPYLFACLFITFVGSYLIGKITNEQFRLAHHAFKKMILDSEKIFLSHPTRMRDRARVHGALTKFLQTIDGPTNCFPSLHVSLVNLAYQIIKDEPKPEPHFIEAMRSTCIDICRSTLKTKQHSIIDVIGGMTIANEIYLEIHQGKVEDLLPEVLPELGETRIQFVREKIAECRTDLPKLMNTLLTAWSA